MPPPYATEQETAAERRERLILEHLPLVSLIARKIHDHVPPSVCLDDLVSIGVVGLISAIDNFDPAHEVKIRTYAQYKIRGAILDSLRSLDWGSRRRRKKAKEIEAAIAAAQQKFKRAPAEDEIAAQMNLTLEEYQATLTGIQGLTLESLEQVVGGNGDTTLIELIPGSEEDMPSRMVERAELQRLMARVIDEMPKSERTVLSLYYHEELTLAEISRVMNLHIAQVSRWKSQAILRLRATIEAQWPVPRGR